MHTSLAAVVSSLSCYWAQWVEIGKPHDQCLSPFNVRTDHQGILFKQIFWFRRSAFLRSHQMLLLLLIQETHFENTWLRWGPKRPKVPQWLSFLNGAGSVLPFGLLIWLPCGSSFSSYLSTIILLRLFFYIERWWFLQLPEGHLSIVRGISLCYLRKCSVFESPVMRDKKEHNFYPPP